MAGVDDLLDSLPGWLISALNFGQSYPVGDERALFALGDAWEQAGRDLRALEPDIKRVTDQTLKYYTGEGATQAHREFAKLFNGKASVEENAKALEELGDYTRNGATELEYTKIMDVGFAAITLYTVISLMAAWPWGEALVPVTLTAGRETLEITAEQGLKRLAAKAGEVGLKNLLKPYLKQIGIAGLKEGAKGAALDAGTQLYQIGAGHRDHGFDVGQTLKTGLEWGAGAAVGAGFGMGAGALGAKLGFGPRLNGLVSGIVGGAGGGLGMYGADVGWQIGSQLAHGYFDPSKVDFTFHPETLTPGIVLGAAHGMKSGIEMASRQGPPPPPPAGSVSTAPRPDTPTPGAAERNPVPPPDHAQADNPTGQHHDPRRRNPPQATRTSTARTRSTPRAATRPPRMSTVIKRCGVIAPLPQLPLPPRRLTRKMARALRIRARRPPTPARRRRPRNLSGPTGPSHPPRTRSASRRPRSTASPNRLRPNATPRPQNVPHPVPV
ncbi:hypothetical protein [Nocardia arthritidis]|uniref:WXG100-like domain-containing protein n=1 Tax=Nocardia arthritidis TaxID=228602 RepID=UPI00142E2C2E|nr:hypothetical protein [Nocardia arthritidis]